MKPYGVTALVAAVVLTVGSGGSVTAQKGKPKPGPTFGTATFDCVTPDETRGLCATSSIAAEVTTGGPNEMELRSAPTMVLNFNGQRPEDTIFTDCSTVNANCRWDGNWSRDVRSGDFQGFSLGTNIIAADGVTELQGGLLGMAVNQAGYKVRLNMTITVPETAGFWRFNFNPNTPGTGGGELADVVRTGGCTWEFSATTQRAALSILLKDKGPQVLHREGAHVMPFRLTLEVPNLGNCG